MEGCKLKLFDSSSRPPPDRGLIQIMKEMISTLVSKADLSPEQAEKVAGVVRQFLKDKLPDAMEGPVLAALSGDNVEAAVGKAKDMFSKLF
jgi:hypothetical protein